MNDAVKQGTASEMGQGTAVPPSEAGRKSCVWELGSWSKARVGEAEDLGHGEQVYLAEGHRVRE